VKVSELKEGVSYHGLGDFVNDYVYFLTYDPEEEHRFYFKDSRFYQGLPNYHIKDKLPLYHVLQMDAQAEEVARAFAEEERQRYANI
jgi:hypothetical protein